MSPSITAPPSAGTAEARHLAAQPFADRGELDPPGLPHGQRPDEHHELLPAEPTDEVVAAHGRPQRPGDRGEHVVAREVAVLVVDRP